MTDPGKPEAGEVRISWESRGVRYSATAADLAPAFVPAASLTAAETRVKAWDRQAIVTAIKAMTPGERTLLLIDVVEDSSAMGQMRRERDEASSLASEQRERAERLSAMHDDLGDRPPGLTLERDDNDGNYEPGNCRWATRAEQSRNQRTTVRLEHAGRTQCLADWSKEFGLEPNTLRRRLKSGWSVAEAIETPGRQAR